MRELLFLISLLLRFNKAEIMIIDKDALIKSFEAYTPDIVGEIIDIFLEEYPEKMSSLEESLDKKDTELLRTTAHGFKGVLAHFSAEKPWSLTKELEIKGQNKDFDNVDEIIARLKVDTEAMIEELKEIKEQYYS